MYLYAMKPVKNNRINKRVMFFHREVNLEPANNSIYLLIVQLEDGEPVHAFYFIVPDNYLNDSLLCGLHQKFNPYCPN